MGIPFDMSSNEPWNNHKQADASGTPAKGAPESRFIDAKEMEQRETYESHYRRIYPLLTKGELDFRQVARETGLKERKIRDTLLHRMTGDDMIQLFGHKEGICYICASRMRGNLTDEPLCIPCIEAIGQAIQEVHRVQPTTPIITEASPISSVAPDPAPQRPVIPSEEMVPKEKYDAILKEVQRYRKKYGPLDETETDAKNATDGDDASAAQDAGHTMRDILAADDEPDADTNHVTLSPNDKPRASESAPSEPIRHFGFQRLRSKN